jgi:homoserine kinase type II
MAVYTEVNVDDLEVFLARYDLGRLLSCKGIAEGVENTNYLLQTERDHFILTLYERRTKSEDLPFFLGLMDHLAAKGIACPTPVHDRQGKSLSELCGRPAAIVSFLPGMSAQRIAPQHCLQLGESLAEFHLAGADFSGQRINALSVSGWRPLFESAASRADEIKTGLREEIAAELATLEANWPSDLPSGVIHADLFPDNVFFLGDKLSGLIDFYFACTDFLAYDLAVCLNAWCFEVDGSYNATKGRQLLAGYRRIRELTPAEVEAFPLLARGAAMRFLLTRLYDWLNTPTGAMVKRKDPLEYLRKLRFHSGISGPGAYGL